MGQGTCLYIPRMVEALMFFNLWGSAKKIGSILY